MSITCHSWSDFLTEVKWDRNKDHLSGIHMVPRQTKALGLDYDKAWGLSLASALDSSPQYSRQKCMCSRENTGYKNGNTYIILVSNQSTWQLPTSLLNWTGTAINPPWKWLNGTQFEWYGCQVTRELKVMKVYISLQDRIWAGMQHLSSSCQKAHQALDEQRPYKHWEFIAGQTQGKDFLLGLSAKGTRKLLELNMNQLRWVTGLFTEHCHLKKHLYTFGLAKTPLLKGARTKIKQLHTSYMTMKFKLT